MLRKVKRRVSIRIDMTPMVDVIILLLIFFFMTASFKQPDAVEVTLPYAAAGVKVPKDLEQISIVIDKDGQVYVNNKLVENRGDIVKLTKKARIETPLAITTVRAEEDVEYGVIQDVMKELAEANILRFNLEVQKEEGAW